MLDQIIILFISIIVSTVGTIAGFGGAIFLVPILMLFFGFPLEIAVGSVIVALVPSSLLSTFFNFRNRTIDFKTGLMLEAPTVVGTFIGAVLISLLPVFPLKVVFSAFIMIMGFLMLKGNASEEEQNKKTFVEKLNKLKPSFIIKNRSHYVAYQVSAWLIAFFGLVTGMLAGMFGVGGGFMKTPIMIKIFKMPHKIATSTALFMIVITSFTGSVSHYLLGHVHWDKSIPVIIGFLIGAIIGKFLNMKMNSKILDRIIATALILAGIAVLVNAFVR